MDDDLLIIAMRRDADFLFRHAPAPDAAVLWHRVKQARAQRIQAIMNISCWSLRAGLALVFAGVAVFRPDALAELALPLALIGWLSTGISVRAVTPKK